MKRGSGERGVEEAESGAEFGGGEGEGGAATRKWREARRTATVEKRVVKCESERK